MKKLFEEPKINVETFPVEDVITASGTATLSLEEDETEIVPK